MQKRVSHLGYTQKSELIKEAMNIAVELWTPLPIENPVESFPKRRTRVF